jgi:glutamate racemase
MGGAIGVFDSGYGGLTIFSQFRRLMPEYDYVYLGDNARAPYGPRSFDIVYQFTKQAVFRLFDEGCPLVIIACNTASAKALRTVQQRDLPLSGDNWLRVLGIIRPTVEAFGSLTRTRHVGVLATEGTIASASYVLETAKLFPDITITGEACPMWAPLVECREYDSPGAEYFVNKHVRHILAADPLIDVLALGCTHYPLLERLLRQAVPTGVRLVSQGAYVAASLKDYLLRHPDMNARLTQGGSQRFLTTETPEKFSSMASLFLNETAVAQQITLN